jgi:DNA-binding beta-propeller fold protein YncE
MNCVGSGASTLLKTRILLGALGASFSMGIGSVAAADPTSNARFVIQELALPGANGLVSLDYFMFDAARHRLWVPASNTGSVDIIDGNTGQVSALGGFPTAQVEFKGKRPVFGPSSVTLGDGVVYVGNRGDSTVCAIDAHALKIGECLAIGSPSEGLSAAPDALTYVAATRELWVTRGVPPMEVPSSDRAITVLDASEPAHLRRKDKIALGASAEGFAVDNQRGRFYTSLEERGETVSIDVHRHEIVSRWHSGCDEPHGLALDAARGILFVACTARVVTMDVAHDGQILGSIDTGAGLDNIDYMPSTKTLYAAAAEAAVLTVARVDEHGIPRRVAVIPTVNGARGVIVDSEGNAYVIDPLRGRVLKITFRSKPTHRG